MRWETACALLLFFAATAVVSPAQTLTTLVNLDNSDGSYPGSLVQATDGSLYGITVEGGTNFPKTCTYGCGTIFKITPDGAFTNLLSFEATNGDEPVGLLQATNGYLYGAASAGGANGYGTIFAINLSGALTTLYSFSNDDSAEPQGLVQASPGPLVQVANGNLYGTTTYGGANDEGSIFQITPAGALTTLYSFKGMDGIQPYGALVQASDGNLFGTTQYEGSSTGDGTIFKITPAGALTTLHRFDGTDGAYPSGGLVQGTDGDLYGTTRSGGAYDFGTVFKITLAGALSTLYSFCASTDLGYCDDGATPEAGLVHATDGNLYGTTVLGGANDKGTIFQITPTGAFASLHSFDGTDGGHPGAALTQDTNGDFYGSTNSGIKSNCTAAACGTVFRFSVGLGPFVKALPAVGQVGSTVRILGTDLTGATSVSFNRTPAAFIVASPTQILTRVPAGASTGKVQVITPGGTLLSNVGFVVP
jgi:uncharacterized repeat protein (TIGR03803 family)